MTKFLFSFLFISVFTASLVLIKDAHAAGRLDVYVHVNGPGDVCVRSVGEDLGCKTANGQDMVKFKFSEDEVDIGDTFEACFEGNCIVGSNNPEIKPEEVYFTEPGIGANNPGTVLPNSDNSAAAEAEAADPKNNAGTVLPNSDNSAAVAAEAAVAAAANKSTIDTWQLTVNMINPPVGINNFYVYVTGPNGNTESASGLWNDHILSENNPNNATAVIDMPPGEIPVGEMFRVCPNYDFIGSAITNSPCSWFTHSSNGNMQVTVSIT